eukprot:c19717_g2_i2 orf=648-2141(-)
MPDAGERSASSAAGVAHVVVVPVPAQGHINPMMPIVHFLAASGITVTLVHTSRSHSLLASTHPESKIATDAETTRPISSCGSRNLRVEVIADGLPFDYKQRIRVELIMNTVFPLMRTGMESLLHKLMHQPEADLPPPCCLILDGFLPWGRDLALKFGLPRFLLWPCSATLLSMGLHVPQLIARGYIPQTEEGRMEKAVDFLPGVPPFRVSDMPDSLRAKEGLQSSTFKFFSSVFEHLKDADCILANTIYELESSIVDALRMEAGVPIHPVGPLCMLSSSSTASLLCEDKSCLSWLDKQQDSSVLYISFGSMVTFEDDTFIELAYGLEASSEKFLWVIRPDALADKASIEELLPEGFIKRTCERGLVVSWTPQLAVLGHASVGAFLTHCGWNSVMESLSKGVPMLGFPGKSDQITNFKCIVHDWKVGLPISGAYSAEHVAGKLERSDVQRAVSGIIRGEEGMQVRARAREWKEIAHKHKPNTKAHLEKLVDDIKQGFF